MPNFRNTFKMYDAGVRREIPVGGHHGRSSIAR
jgi:hypothetical protein